MTVNVDRQNSVVDGLRDIGYAAGRIDSVLDAPITTTPEWGEFLTSWERLVLDPFMADGGDYRIRRYSEFDCTADSVHLLPHRAYRQSKQINRLNGGVERLFEPFEDGVANGPVVRALLSWCARRLDAVEGRPATWYAQCFQNRILARSAKEGQPTPEGIHRDGVDYVFTVVVDRRGVVGGESSLYATQVDGGPGERLVSVTLEPPGDFLFNDDDITLHGVSPLTASVVGGEGYRDTFIAVLTRRP
ncbi:2OG-Fe dioxygenase family protein [Streptomyces sioyaensis]|uniref:2OG-Fe dioxygenase family protein n=1 Tax=Streptomyces sioyaensis TaxID=67364 RepID=UPI0037929F64